MDHRRFNAENGQDDEGKVVIRGDHDAVTGRTGMFVRNASQFAFGIYRSSHPRRGKYAPILCRADRDIEIFVLSIRDRLEARVFEEEPDHDATGFVLDRRDARVVHFLVGEAICPKQ